MKRHWKDIHESALQATAGFKRSEAVLLEILIEADRERIFEHFGLTSTFAYCVNCLQLTEEQAYTFIRVARKSVEAPELKKAIHDGSLTVSKAKKIAAVVTQANQNEWVEKAKTLSTRALEREVAIVSPQTSIAERIRPVAQDLFELRCSLDAETQRLLQRTQDLLSQKLGAHTNVTTALKASLSEFVERHDPVAKARRTQSSTRLSKSPASTPALRGGKRVAVPAAIADSVNHRDQGRCTFIHPRFGRCTSRRWLERHHRVSVSQGGQHCARNLVTLCSAHHQQAHHPVGLGPLPPSLLGVFRNRSETRI